MHTSVPAPRSMYSVLKAGAAFSKFDFLTALEKSFEAADEGISKARSRSRPKKDRLQNTDANYPVLQNLELLSNCGGNVFMSLLYLHSYSKWTR